MGQSMRYIVLVSKNKLSKDCENEAEPILICGEPLVYHSLKKAKKAAKSALENYLCTDEFKSGLRINNIQRVRFAKVVPLEV